MTFPTGSAALAGAGTMLAISTARTIETCRNTWAPLKRLQCETYPDRARLPVMACAVIDAHACAPPSSFRRVLRPHIEQPAHRMRKLGTPRGLVVFGLRHD